MLFKYLILLLIPLLLSAFTHLWNPIGFPFPNVDEGIYLGRAVNFIDTSDPKDPYIGYDHPYFGHIFIAAFLYITGFQNFLTSNNYLNYEMLLLIPRILMGVLAVIDTFLLFKIVDIRYNTRTAFIASILFAVMPITWLTRWVLLDSIQLPFILLSILFAILSSNAVSASSRRKNFLLVLISGSFLGLSVFTKIPSFTMIPLIGYLVFTQNKKSSKILIVWLLPVIFIPSIWVLHAISVNEFDEWWDAINNQTHRESRPLWIAINDFFKIDPLLLFVALPSLIYAVIKRDLFILLSVFPFLIFMYLIGYVVIFHLILLAAFLCMSTAILFVDIHSFVRKKNALLRFASIGGIVLVVVLGLTSTTKQIIVDSNSQYFKAARFIDQYLESNQTHSNNLNLNKTGGITMISHPFFFWIDKYKFHDKDYYYWNADKFENRQIISIIDGLFKQVVEQNDYEGRKFRNFFSSFDTTQLISFKNNSLYDSAINILLTDLNRYNQSTINLTNVLDEDNDWTNSKDMSIQRTNEIMNMTVDTNKANKKDNVNHAYLNDAMHLNGPPIYLSTTYSMPIYSKASTFTIEINDAENNSTLWHHQLRKRQGITVSEFFILPENISGRKINLDIRIHSYENDIDSLILKELSFYY